jgi:hypothetical protein
VDTTRLVTRLANRQQQPPPTGSPVTHSHQWLLHGVALNAYFAATETWIIGHLRVWDRANITPHLNADLRANVSELPTERLQRLGAEDSIRIAVPTVALADTSPMGSQPDGTSLDLYQQTVETDVGVLYERGYGLGYLPRALRYNQPATLVIDLATYQTSRSELSKVLLPVYDDQNITNEWTVSRVGGSSATYRDLASQRRGTYRDKAEVNTLDDDPLMDQAAWRTRLTTTPEMREDSIPIDLAAKPGLIDAALCLGPGSRIQRINPPSQYPGPSDKIVEGWSETIGPRSWLMQITASPAGPWDVATVDDEDERMPADGSTLAASLAVGGMTLSLASTTANGFWWVGNTTTWPLDFPMQLIIGGGEVVTATAISGSSSPQTVTLSSRGDTGITRAWPSGTSVDVYDPPILAL